MLSRFQLRFVITLFFVSFMSDLLLNDLVRKPLSNYHNSIIIKSLESYFKDKSIIQAGSFAGLTVAIAYLLLMLIWNMLGLGNIPTRELVYSKFNGNIIITLLYELFGAFILGYIIDVIIHKLNIFGSSLDNYYTIAGSGVWGATAFVFAICITYVLLRLFFRYLD